MTINGTSFPDNAWGEVEATRHCQRTGEVVIGVRDGRIYTAKTCNQRCIEHLAQRVAELERRAGI